MRYAKKIMNLDEVLREMRSEEWQGGDAVPQVEKWADAIEAAAQRLKDALNGMKGIANTQAEIIGEQHREIVELRDALEFYANRRRYDNSIAIDRGDGSCDYSLEILEDVGATARAALAERNEGE